MNYMKQATAIMRDILGESAAMSPSKSKPELMSPQIDELDESGSNNMSSA